MKEEFEILEETAKEISKEDSAMQAAVDDAAQEIPETPLEEKKKSRGRKKAETGSVVAAEEAAPTLVPSEGMEDVKKQENGLKTEILQRKDPCPRLKAHLRRGFQLKGRYYSRTELGRARVLEKLYQTYPRLFE